MKDREYARVIATLGGRKFIFASGLLSIICGLFAAGILTEASFVELVEWTGAGYLGANGISKIGGRSNGDQI